MAGPVFPIDIKSYKNAFKYQFYRYTRYVGWKKDTTGMIGFFILPRTPKKAAYFRPRKPPESELCKFKNEGWSAEERNDIVMKTLHNKPMTEDIKKREDFRNDAHFCNLKRY